MYAMGDMQSRLELPVSDGRLVCVRVCVCVCVWPKGNEQAYGRYLKQTLAATVSPVPGRRPGITKQEALLQVHWQKHRKKENVA
jgi:hypothetical protein